MKNLRTQKFVFGLLAAFVLALGVQGVVDALTFGTSKSGDLKTVFPGEEFSITFSVKLNSSKDIYNTTTPKRQVQENGTTLINSSGYPAKYVGSTQYRLVDSSNLPTASGTFVYKKGTDYTNATSAKFVLDNSNNNIYEEVTAEGKAYPVYDRTGSGSTDDPYSYGSQIIGQPQPQLSDSLQHNYNDEAIAIYASSSDISLKRNNTTISVVTSRPGRLSSLATLEGTGYSLAEDNRNRDLPSDKTLSSSITLKGQAPSAPGQYIIEAIDVTHANDYPAGDRPSVQARIAFTIYVVPTDSLRAPDLSFSADGRRTNDYVTGLTDNADPKIDTLFGTGNQAFDDTQKNSTPLTYKVEGSGRLYVEETYNSVNNYERPPQSKSSTSQTITTSAHATVRLDMNGSSNKVTVYVRDKPPNTTGKTLHFIFKYAQIEIVSGNNQTGEPNARLVNPLTIRVKDSKGRAISGLAVSFDPADEDTLQHVIGTDVYLTSTDAWAADFQTIAKTQQATTTVPAAIAVNANGWVPTDSSGEAKVYLKQGAAADPVASRTVTVRAGDATVRFYAISSPSNAIPILEIRSGNNQRAASGGKVENPLVVRVLASTNSPLQGRRVTFTTTKGYLTTPTAYRSSSNPATVNGPATQVTAATDVNGEAAVTYDLVNNTGASDVIAEISSAPNTVPVYQRRVTFKINSGTDTTQPTVTPYLRLSVSPSSGEAGTTGTVTVTAYGENNTALSGVSVNLSGTGITLPSFVTSGQVTSFTFPSSSTTINASAPNYTGTSSTITVTQPTQTVSSIAVASGNNQTGEPGESLTSPLKVRITDANGNAVENQPVRFRIASGAGASLSTRGDLTDRSGEAETLLTLGPSTGTYTVEAEATEIDEDVTFTATAVATPTRIEIVSGNNQEGSAGGVLSRPFVVKVTDKRQEAIAGVEVTFRETSNLGKFSGQTSDVAVTDAQGVAESSRMTIVESGYGVLFVKASASASLSVNFKADGGDPPSDLVSISGNNQTAKPEGKLKAPFVVEVLSDDDSPFEGAIVAFKVTGGGGKLSATSVKTDARGRAQTFLTLGKARGENTVQASTSGVSGTVKFSALAGAEVLVPAGQRPEMYWVNRQDGRLQRLVADRVETIAPNITGITSLAIDTRNGLIYWGRQTGENRGTLQRAGLNGKGVVTLGTSQSFPTSVALNADGTTVYWTSSNGRIKSMPTRGVRKTTLLRKGLPGPTGLVWANDSLYWGESTGRIRRMNLKASGNPVQNLVTGLGVPVSLAAHGGKVYWTETSGDASQLKRANTNGTDVETLKTLTGSKRVWLSIEGSAARLYLTRLSAVERRSLSGRSTKVIVSGLQSPGSIVLGVGSVASTPVVKQPPQQTQPSENNTTYSKYDVNKDGAVNNADTRAVAGAIGQSGAAITNTRTDVDGSGAVDVTDLILVIANLDDDVAAPAIALDVKALDIDFDRVQEQVEALLSSGDRSVAAQRALLYLRHLLASARPSETVLLANYPNPFNPETWIPYHLASATDVHINIYDAQGRLVRALVLGHQTAGYYTSRSRAAYWDGRNAFGEQVASGIYFYQLQTDEMSSMRKMVILK